MTPGAQAGLVGRGAAGHKQECWPGEGVVGGQAGVHSYPGHGRE